ncbi:MAG: dihydroneopterin aldolase [Limisphaerales bacterium]
MDQITIKDLEVFYRVGVTEEERAKPQRLLLTIELIHSFEAAAAADDLEKTINYYAVAQRLLRFGETRAWSLIETAAVEIARMVMDEFKPQKVSVEVKKFVVPQAGYVSVRVSRSRED